MHEVIIKECGREAQGLNCRQRKGKELIKLRMAVDPEYVSGYDSIKTVGLSDLNGIPIEKAWIDQLQAGHGECPHCESPCVLRIRSRQQKAEVDEGLDAFGDVLTTLFSR